jgi:hypothetical protein
MRLSIKHIGSYGGNAAKLVELTIDLFNGTYTEDVTNLHGFVDEELISNLREIADELEEHNRKKNETE